MVHLLTIAASEEYASSLSYLMLTFFFHFSPSLLLLCYAAWSPSSDDSGDHEGVEVIMVSAAGNTQFVHSSSVFTDKSAEKRYG
jgi:hypothetical protein